MRLSLIFMVLITLSAYTLQSLKNTMTDEFKKDAYGCYFDIYLWSENGYIVLFQSRP
jgi:hypothetical protein